MKKILSFIPLLVMTTFSVFSQNVGVGVNNPLEKLHVAGNVKADTVKSSVLKMSNNPGTGKVLTSDASGNASWQKIGATSGESGGFGSWGDCSMSGLTDYLPVADSSSNQGNLFGFAVAVSGDFSFVGIPFDDIGGNENQGSVWVYQFVEGKWTFIQKITDNTGAASDFFGNSISVSGNFLVIGAKADDIGASIDQGSVSVYQLNGSSWNFMQKITDATGAAEDFFANSVSISGNYIAVGASEDNVINVNQGSVSIYQFNGSSWVLMQKIIDGTATIEERFGESVSVSGNLLVVGEPKDDISSNQDQGSVLFYRYNGSSWVLLQKQTDAEGSEFNLFGASVSISGNYAAIGSFGYDVGADQAQGSVCIYFFNGSNWIFVQRLIDPAGGASDYFGISVCLSGNLLTVGANHDEIDGQISRGSVSIFSRVGNGWGKIQSMVDKMGNEADYFGSAVSIDGNNRRFIVGAWGYLDDRGKAVFGKVQ